MLALNQTRNIFGEPKFAPNPHLPKPQKDPWWIIWIFGILVAYYIKLNS